MKYSMSVPNVGLSSVKLVISGHAIDRLLSHLAVPQSSRERIH